MTTRYDEKGKYFTDLISKNEIPVILQTTTGRIEGYIFVRSDSRIIDEINSAELFVAVTAARVLDLNGNLLYRAKFLSINRNQIVWILPFQELLEESQIGGEA